MCELMAHDPTGETVSAVRYVAALLADDERRALERGLEVAELLTRADIAHYRAAGRRSVDACLACDPGLEYFSSSLAVQAAG